MNTAKIIPINEQEMGEMGKKKEKSNFFQCQNELVDELLMHLSGAELKCYLVISRKTTGWNKKHDRISISQFMQLTGLSNKAVISACQKLESIGLIDSEKLENNTKIYSLTYEESSQVISKVKQATYEESSQQPVKKVHKGCEESSQQPVKKVHTQNTLSKYTIQNTLSKDSCSDVANAIAASDCESVDSEKTGLAQTTVAKKTQPTKKPKPTPEESEANKLTWTAYSTAYKNRYSVEPLRNAQVNGIISKFVKLVGADDAPHIARFFINISNQFYVQKLHDVKLLLSDAQAIRTQWLTKRTVSATQARQADTVQAAQSSVDGVLARRAKRAAEASVSAFNDESVIDGECRNV